MRRRHILDQLGGPHEPADPPPGSIEVLAGGPDRQRDPLDLGRQRGDPGEGHVVQPVVHLVGEDDDVVPEADVGDPLELPPGEDLADGVVRGVDDDHLGARRDGPLELVEVDGPLGRRARPGGALGGRTILPPGISMLLMYWSKKGSKMMTSSPGSMKAMNALSMPSFAPVVMVTSVSGSSLRPQCGAYASAMACLRRGRPLVGEYWLQSTRFSASLAASRMNCGGLYPKKPWPMFTMGWTGDAAAASLMMDLEVRRTSCLLPATRAAGFIFPLMVIAV
ncbi:hypothetical protein VM1G_11930 [Cytospora mali]|uniref:Uncharacterized protein n=1 Tax=Cytospora mali TaxID=578113 RepID=A0A194WCF9_CYTMA|nr:hypothetical protein VM1G_11930 [Valsa mali]